MNLPVWCACGKIITFPGETRCEDCWADDQRRFHGYSRNVQTMTDSSEAQTHVLPTTKRVHPKSRPAT